MSIRINNEGRTRYIRKYLLPRCGETLTVEDGVYFDAPYGGRGMYWGKFIIAKFSYKTLSIVFRCPHCGLQMYGIWYRDEKFIAQRKGHKDSCAFEPKYILAEHKITFKELWASEEREREEYAKTSAKIEEEIRTVRAMKNCPICGELLSEKYEEERENTSPRESFIELSLDKLVYKREYNSSGLAKDSIQRIKNSTSLQTVDTDKNRIINDPNLLQEYIRHLLNAETTIITLEKRLSRLYWDSAEYQECYIRQLAEQMSVLAGKQYQRSNYAEPTISAVVLKEPKPIEPCFAERWPVEPQYDKPGLFNKKKVLVQNEVLRSKYELDCQAYQRKKAEYEEKLKEYESAINMYNKKRQEEFERRLSEHRCEKEASKRSFLANIEHEKTEITNHLGNYLLYQEALKEIQLIKEMYSQSYSCLQKLYSCGVVYEKYHNPVALASFYDYLAAGRCTTLTGADGAYNIYETEMRMDCIITKFDVVIKQLEQIKNSQYALYSAMCEMNSNLNMLNTTTGKMEDSLKSINCYQKDISNNTAVIAHNTAVTALYAKKTAELTDALGFMVALK